MGKEICVVDIESDCTDKISDDLEKVKRNIDRPTFMGCKNLKEIKILNCKLYRRGNILEMYRT